MAKAIALMARLKRRRSVGKHPVPSPPTTIGCTCENVRLNSFGLCSYEARACGATLVATKFVLLADYIPDVFDVHGKAEDRPIQTTYRRQTNAKQDIARPAIA